VGQRPRLRALHREAHLTDIAINVLLVAAVLAQLISALGLLVMRTSADRLHYTSAAFTVGPFCVLAAVLLREGMTTASYDTIATVGLMFLAGPVIVHATARAGRRQEVGHPQPRPEERVR
jgi:multisubunit Na+/H+ antiporter MnhG subunit